MSIEDDVALLERVPTLRVLGTTALRMLAIGSEQRNVTRNATLFHTGEDADSGFIVQRGSFRIEDSANAAVVAGSGSLIGELALITAMQRDEALAVAFHERFLAPVEQRTRTIFERAKARGEIADDVDLALIGSVLPSIAIFRALARNEAVGPELIEQIVDQVVLPACRGCAAPD